MSKHILYVEPKPQSRPRFSRHGRAYELKDMTDWKKTVSQTLLYQKAKPILKGPIYVSVTFYIYPPKRISKIDSKRPRPNRLIEKMYVDKRPDLDNYVKAILDASNEILFKDDGQIAVLTSQKLYSLDPRIEIEVTELRKKDEE